MRKLRLLLASALAAISLAGCAKPTPSVEPVTYTVTWVVEGETVETDTVEEGVVPTFDGETPVKAGDADVAVYEFASWTPKVVAAFADATYVATFTAVTTTKEVALAACEEVTTAIFGPGSITAQDYWNDYKLIVFGANVGASYSLEICGALLDSVLASDEGLGYTADFAVALDENDGHYVGKYTNATTGVIAYPDIYTSSNNTIITCSFTHVNCSVGN